MPRVLQLRLAHHQPKLLKLETGTTLEEPPGIEGYLTRHKSGSSPKERVFVASHDGESAFTSALARVGSDPHRKHLHVVPWQSETTFTSSNRKLDSERPLSGSLQRVYGRRKKTDEQVHRAISGMYRSTEH